MMIWRCLVLYEGTGRCRWNLFLGFIGLLVLISLGSGLLLFALIFKTTHLVGSLFMIAVPCATSITNIIFATLITLRLLWHQSRMKEALGWAYKSPYTRIITICIESCSLIIVVCIAFLVIRLGDLPGRVILEMLLTPVSVLSPLLMIHNVAKGRDIVSTIHTRQIEIRIADLMAQPHGRVGNTSSSIRFDPDYTTSSCDHGP
ncbi:unnamed protein product [Cyclocybe aegerita]|uniref:Uncharacterized protein n=1 Tax=Cyclocybe aegerita TaxID=1973307 RepID=A0A8S0WT34_CYCAE|nr:unnamed protein product [Cyclocybe aegerita]